MCKLACAQTTCEPPAACRRLADGLQTACRRLADGLRVKCNMANEGTTCTSKPLTSYLILQANGFTELESFTE